MIEAGDFSRPAQIRVQVGERRDWLFRKRPVWRVIFVGFVEHMENEMHRGTRITLVDAMTRLSRAQAMQAEVEALTALKERLS